MARISLAQVRPLPSTPNKHFASASILSIAETGHMAVKRMVNLAHGLGRHGEVSFQSAKRLPVWPYARLPRKNPSPFDALSHP